jgi:hypothetical protein
LRMTSFTMIQIMRNRATISRNQYGSSLIRGGQTSRPYDNFYGCIKFYIIASSNPAA